MGILGIKAIAQWFQGSGIWESWTLQVPAQEVHIMDFLDVSYGVFTEFHTGLTGLYGFIRALNL